MSDKMGEINKAFETFSNVMNQNTKAVKIGCCSIAFVGLTIAMRRVRPFSRFRKPSDIPNLFLHERRELVGTVKSIEPNGSLLMVEHRPVVKIPGIASGALPVKISGINVTGHGISWLQSIVAGHEVKFVPITKAKDYVQCEVDLPQVTYDMKPRIVNVGQSLVSIGFGTIAEVEKPLSANKAHVAYCKKLKAAELTALRKKLGVRYYIKPTKLAFQSIATNINKMVHKAMKRTNKVPKIAAV